MRTSLTQIISLLRVISDLANTESDSIERLFGKTDLGMSLGDPDTLLMLSEPKPVHQALKTFLAVLPEEYLYSLILLMYSGRDGDSDHLALLSHLRVQYDSQSDAISAICEKAPRMDYIDKGINSVGATSLDELPTKIKENS